MIYTAGYHGHTGLELKAKVAELNALVVDIRLFACSQQNDWDRDTLTVEFGNRYTQNVHWGNLNYKPIDRHKGIKLANWEAGMRLFQHRLQERQPDHVILLCVCPCAQTCHRTFVADLLRLEGEHVEELDW